MTKASFVSPRHFADLVGRCTETVRIWVRRGHLKVSRTPGGGILIHRSEVDRILAGEPPEGT